MTSWAELLKKATELNSDEGRLQHTMSDDDLVRKFDSGLGVGEFTAPPFTAWSDKWVYFPLAYDGSVYVGWAPRNPCDISMKPQ